MWGHVPATLSQPATREWPPQPSMGEQEAWVSGRPNQVLSRGPTPAAGLEVHSWEESRAVVLRVADSSRTREGCGPQAWGCPEPPAGSGWPPPLSSRFLSSCRVPRCGRQTLPHDLVSLRVNTLQLVSIRTAAREFLLFSVEPVRWLSLGAAAVPPGPGLTVRSKTVGRVGHAAACCFRHLC